jgi:lysophospholipase L1-like esterase
MNGRKLASLTAWPLLLCTASLVAAAASLPKQSWEPEIRMFEAADRAHPPPQGAILFIGSSSIRLWKTLAQDFPDQQVINRGFGGCQIADCAMYVDRIVVPYHPRFIVLRAGCNDIAAGKTPERVCDDFREFVARVRKKLPKVPIAFMSMDATPARWGNVQRETKGNQLIRQVVAKGENLDYIDTASATLGVDRKPRKELFVKDQIHFNAEGYKILTACVRSHLPAPTRKTTAPQSSTAAPTDHVVAKLGTRQVILASGQYGLKYFPDECLAFIQTKPQLRVLMAATVSTWLLEGRDMNSLVPRKQVLTPGKPGSFDNGYTGVCGVAREPHSGDLLAFYHAEDHEGMPPIPGGIPGFYCSVGLAVSHDDGASFHKRGPVIIGAQTKNVKGRPDQGAGDLCVVADAEGRYLYLYYTDHSRVDKRGVQICMARCALGDAGKVDQWKKFYRGAFDQPGLHGKETPVVSAAAMHADAIFPQVTFVREMRRYVMVFNVVVPTEYGPGVKPSRSGIYLATSLDGIHWQKPAQLLAVQSIVNIDKEVGWHPVLLLSDVNGTSARGWLYYSYSERWGHKAPQTPHYLVGHPITFSLVAENSPALGKS